MIITIMRDGKICLGCDLGPPCGSVAPTDLAAAIREVINAGAQKRVYIRADARTKYGYVKEVVDALNSAEIRDVSFIIGYSSGRFKPAIY